MPRPLGSADTRLALISPEKRCGKSRLLDVIEPTCHSPLMTVNISPAALVRSITNEDPPSLLLDEADTIFRGKAAEQHEDLRGILISAHQRNALTSAGTSPLGHGRSAPLSPRSLQRQTHRSERV